MPTEAVQELRDIRGTVFTHFLGLKEEWACRPYVHAMTHDGVIGCLKAWDDGLCGRVLTCVSRCENTAELKKIYRSMCQLHMLCFTGKLSVWDTEQERANRVMAFQILQELNVV